MQENKTNKLLSSYDGEERSEFKDRLKLLLGETAETVFARRCNVPPSSMRKYLNGSVPGIDKVIKIAEATGKSVQWLVTGEEVAERVEYIESPTTGEPSDFDDFVLIPGYSVQVSAGNGSAGSDTQVPSRYLAFRRQWLQYKGFKQQDLIALWAKGDSMEPLIGDNNTLIVHTTEKQPDDGNIYVLRLENQLWVKRIQVTPLGSYLLISDNSIYPPMEIKKEEMGNFDVIGRVVHIAKDV